MESEILDGNLSPKGVGLSDQAKGFLASTAKWAKFFSILGFIWIGMMVIGAFSIGTIMSSTMAATNPDMGFLSSGAITVFYLILAAAMFMPMLYQFQFANNTQEALRRNDDVKMTLAFEKLKAYYKFYGIITILFLGFYVLMIVFIGLGTAMS